MQIRREFRVTGTVQGVGFRPFVFRLAEELGLAGSVRNTAAGVVIEVEGDEGRVGEFVRRLETEAPPLARIGSVQVRELEARGGQGFRIVGSDGAAAPTALIPPDVALCADCAREIADPSDRRFGYAFTNCTNCGPRFTIVRGIPYDRVQTTMAAFVMCEECAREYADPRDRRFHAEPVACRRCGPRLRLDGEESGDEIARAAAVLEAGEVLALKGLGGYHLACDARNSEAVETLRERKGRGQKPFAIMVRDLAEARRVAEVSPQAERLLTSAESPVVILPAKAESGLAEGIAPGQHTVGVMLPYTPLHRLLLDQGPPALVMTSGNLAEEPIVHTDEEARERLGPIADRILSHNREIEVPCDDSVVRVEGDLAIPVRRTRGYVPRSIPVEYGGPPVLAVGGYHKNTFCLLRAGEAILSQHIGDLDTAEVLEYFGRAVRHFERLFEVRPEVVAHDLHPDYLSTRWAKALEGVRLVPVQHHHAHVVSVMAECGLDGEVLGVSYDGTGYGEDGTVWGGEILKCDQKTFAREGHLRAVPLPGGEGAIARPARMALSYLRDAFGPEEGLGRARVLLPSLNDQEARLVARQIERGINSPMCSSAGRLFDAVGALLGSTPEVTYEGQPAMELEAMASEWAAEVLLPYRERRAGGTLLPYRYDIENSVIDTRLVVRGIAADLERGVDRAEIAARFHETVAAFTVDLCRRLGEHYGLSEVALSGGVMQNARLVRRLVEGMREVGLTPHVHREVPPNDGGMSLGQAVVASARSS